MTLRTIDKTFELERQVSQLRRDYASCTKNLQAPRLRTEQAIALREPIRELLQNINNTLLCSLLYTGSDFAKQLSSLKGKAQSLESANEVLISKRFQTPTRETASVNLRSKRLISDLGLPPETASGYTGYVDDKALIPVFYFAFKGLKDTAGFVHPRYSVWFKSPREFATGFGSWPTHRGWVKLNNQGAMQEALKDQLLSDGFGES